MVCVLLNLYSTYRYMQCYSIISFFPLCLCVSWFQQRIIHPIYKSQWKFLTLPPNQNQRLFVLISFQHSCTTSSQLIFWVSMLELCLCVAVPFFVFNSIILYKWFVISSNDPFTCTHTHIYESTSTSSSINQLLSLSRVSSWERKVP